MTQLSGMTEIFLHRDVVDFRKSINGLLVVIEDEMKQSPFNNALFVFCNRGRDKIKALYWDETGFCLWYKRLEKDKFKWPRKSKEKCSRLSEAQWEWLLSGLDLTKMQTHQPLYYEAFR
jgi:transposase